MTLERRLIAGLKDIRAIVFECNECKSRTALPPQDIDRPPHSCPRGHGWNWDVPAERQMMVSSHQEFLSGLKTLREGASERASGFKIYLEFEEPEFPAK